MTGNQIGEANPMGDLEEYHHLSRKFTPKFPCQSDKNELPDFNGVIKPHRDCHPLVLSPF